MEMVVRVASLEVGVFKGRFKSLMLPVGMHSPLPQKQDKETMEKMGTEVAVVKEAYVEWVLRLLCIQMVG